MTDRQNAEESAAVAGVMLAAMDASGGGSLSACTGEDGSFDKQRISLEDLKQLKAVFDRAVDEGGSGELDEDQFLKAFSPILGAAMSEEQLRLWFMRVDASANGAVDWDEFSSFLLYSVDKGRTVVTSSGVSIDEVSFVKDPRTAIGNCTEASATRISGYNHADAMTRVLLHPRGKIFTAGQDGTIRIWDGTTLDFEGMLHHGKGWVTDMAFARDYSKIVATTVDRLVLVYDVHTEKLSRGFAGTIDVAAISQSAQPSSHVDVPWLRALRRDEIDRRHVATSSTGGGGNSNRESLQEYRQRHERRREGRHTTATLRLTMLSKMEVPALTLAIVPASATFEGTEQVYVGLTDGSILAYALFGAIGVNEKVEPTMNFPELHAHAFVTCVKWVPGISAVITTGSDGRIHLISPMKKTVTRACERYADDHPIHSCEWIASERLLATCGNDRHVSLWSLSSRGPPIPLKGHLAHVSHIHYREEDNLLFTMDVDKCIKVWDVRTLRPIQSMIDYDTYKPTDKLTVLAYDAKRHCLVTGIVAPVLWSMGRLLVPYPDPAYTGHQKAITAVLYSHVFHQVVTADGDQIKTWAVDSGELISTLSVDSLRSTAVRSSVPSDVYGAVYAACFDGPGRRLVIGVTSGRVLIANFANGQLLQELVPQMPNRERREFSSSECSAMVYFSTGAKCFIGCVRGSELLVWEDVGEGTLEKRLDRIVSLALTKRTYAHFAVITPNADILNGQMRWRPPSPLCLCAMPPGYIAIGTDCGLVIVYSSVSLDVLSVFGVYDLNINISALHYDEKRELLFAGKSDATIDVLSQGMKDTRFTICLRDPWTGRAATATCLDLHPATGLLVVGTDDGYALMFDTAAFSMADVPAGAMNCATLYHPAYGCNFVGGFQAHKDDVCRLQLFAAADLEMAPKKKDGGGGEDELNMTNRSLQSAQSRRSQALATTTMYIVSGGSDCQTRLWVTTDEYGDPANNRSTAAIPLHSADDIIPATITISPAAAAAATDAGGAAASVGKQPRSGGSSTTPQTLLGEAAMPTAAARGLGAAVVALQHAESSSRDVSSRASSASSDPESGAFTVAAVASSSGAFNNNNLSSQRSTFHTVVGAALSAAVPPLPFVDARFVGYCGLAEGWALPDTRGRIEALTSIPAPLTHETTDYFATAREARNPPTWKRVPAKADIVDAHIERGLLAMEDPQTQTSRLRQEAINERKQRLDRVIAAPSLHVTARNRDKALLLSSELTPSSVSVNRNASPSVVPTSSRAGGSPTRATSTALQPSPADVASVGVGHLANGGGATSARAAMPPQPPAATARGGTGRGSIGGGGAASVALTGRNKSRLEAAAAGGLINAAALNRSKRKKSMILMQGMMNGSLLFNGDSDSQRGSPMAASAAAASPSARAAALAAAAKAASARGHRESESMDELPAMSATARPVPGNQTPQLQLPGIPRRSGNPAVATSSPRGAPPVGVGGSPPTAVPTLPKIDTAKARQSAQQDLLIALPNPNQRKDLLIAGDGDAGFLLAMPPQAAGGGGGGGLLAAAPPGTPPGQPSRGRSPNRDALVTMSRVAYEQAAEDARLMDGAKNNPELDDEARLIALERRLPISARIDQWRRTQHARPQRNAVQAWTARPHGQLGLAAMDGDIVASATSGRRRQMMLLDLDQRIARRRGLNM